jgi:hypothetical protein
MVSSTTVSTNATVGSENAYRIPVKHVPRRLGADVLAFYQTQAFADERWSVNYFAPIRRIHLA